MVRKVFALMTIVLFFGVCDLQAAQIASTWVGGESGCWCDPCNWDPNIVPDGDFDVTINGGGGKVQVSLEQNRTINSLHCYGEVELERGQWWNPTLTTLNGLTNHGDLTIHIDIRGDVRNLPGATLQLSEHINIFGNLYNEVGGTITADLIDIDVEEGGEVYNDGLIRCIANGAIGETPYFHNNGQIWLYVGYANGTIFENNVNGMITGCGVISVGSLLQNKGMICASMGPLLIYISEGSPTNTGTLKNNVGATLNIHTSNVDVNNQGVIETNGMGAVVLDCNLVNEPNGTIKLLGGTLAGQTITQKAGATLQGFGGITGDVVIGPDGIIKLTGPTNIVGDVEIKNDATLQISDGLTLVTGHTICNGTIHMKGGYIIPQGGLLGDCDIIWEPGIYTNVADFNLDGQVNFEDFAYFADTWLWQTAWQ